MSRFTCSIVGVALATGLMWGCDGDRVVVDTPRIGAENQAGKLTVQNPSHAEVVFTLKRNGSPVIGAAIEFARRQVQDNGEAVSLSLTDENGQVTLLLLAKDVSGDYEVRAWKGEEQVGAWSIPVQAGYKVIVDLPIGGNAIVTGTFPVTPIEMGPVPSGPDAVTNSSTEPSD